MLNVTFSKSRIFFIYWKTINQSKKENIISIFLLFNIWKKINIIFEKMPKHVYNFSKEHIYLKIDIFSPNYITKLSYINSFRICTHFCFWFKFCLPNQFQISIDFENNKPWISILISEKEDKSKETSIF